jgi:REP element-mobilizing transposase RayT
VQQIQVRRKFPDFTLLNRLEARGKVPLEFTRKAHRLDPNEYLGEKWFFVTICCENRKEIFRASDKALWVIDFLQVESVRNQFLIEAFCVMPDHLHFLAFGIAPTSNLLLFVKSLKQKTAYAYKKDQGATLWQINFYDHIVGPNESSSRVAAYIWLNPVRKGFCRNFEDYPFSGSFTRDWKTALPTESWVPPWKVPA